MHADTFLTLRKAEIETWPKMYGIPSQSIGSLIDNLEHNATNCVKCFQGKQQLRKARNPVQDFGLSKEAGTEAETKTKNKTKIGIYLFFL